jgi:tetratricopeptide (TPR) repeat protein
MDDSHPNLSGRQNDDCANEMRRALEFHREGRLDQAELSYRKILEKNPDHGDALHLLGALCYQKRNFEEAVFYSQAALRHKTGDMDVCGNLGNALFACGRIDEAIRCFQEIIAMRGDDAGAYYNLGNAFKEKALFTDALACYEKAITIDPSMAEAHYNYGNALQDAHQSDAVAIPFYRRAIGIRPGFAEAHWNLSLALLLSGSFAEGWREYEWRRGMREIFPPRDFRGSQWRGEPLSGKRLLLYAEQGFGDVLQFIRYARLLSGRGAEVLVECQRELVSLLSGQEGIAAVYGRGDDLPAYDCHCPILSLPGLFGTDLSNIPGEVPYLRAEDERLSYWRGRLEGDGPGLKVGLSWAGRPTHKKDRQRSLKLMQLAPLGSVAGVTYYSLQKGDAAEESQRPPGGLRLVDYTGELVDFADTAGLVGNLDLVISVDTAVVHLAGGMGKAVWTLLPYAPDWRWLLGREDSPWYPTMCLFRQGKAGDWSEVIGRAAAELTGLVRGRS